MLSALKHSSSFAFCLQPSCSSGFELELELVTLAPLFLGPEAGPGTTPPALLGSSLQEKIMGLLSLHSCMKQFLMINLLK